MSKKNEYKFTPGPWEAVGNSVYQVEGAPKGSYEGSEVAFNISRHMSRGERYANASLIAAAPEMLQALELALIKLNEFTQLHRTDEHIKLCNDMRGIIAKAKGGA